MQCTESSREREREREEIGWNGMRIWRMFGGGGVYCCQMVTIVLKIEMVDCYLIDGWNEYNLIPE
jgi:hypothetical protein